MEQVSHVMTLQSLGLCKWLQMLSFLVFITLERLPVPSCKQDQCVKEVRSSVPHERAQRVPLPLIILNAQLQR